MFICYDLCGLIVKYFDKKLGKYHISDNFIPKIDDNFNTLIELIPNGSLYGMVVNIMIMNIMKFSLIKMKNIKKIVIDCFVL